MSLWGRGHVNLDPRYRYWAECRLGVMSIHTAKLNRGLLGTCKFCCLAILSAWMLQHLGTRSAQIPSNMGIL